MQDEAADQARAEWARTELAGRSELASQLRADNDRRITAVTQRGAKIDAAVFLGIRFEVLCEHLLGPLDGDDKTPARVEYEVACQKRFAAMLSDAEGQITRALLLNGVRQNPGQQ